MSLVETEKVLVVPTELLHALGHFQGFSSDTDRYLETLLAPENTSYRPRREMEEDPNFKQLIPYVLLQHTDDAGLVRLFHYTRGKGQGEKRLHSKRSVGIGGHISSDDADADTTRHPYDEGMRRELEEEVQLDSPYQARCVGLINDDETEVGRVHLGIVHVFELESPLVQPNEEDIAHTGFETLDQLKRELDQFETWSQICLRGLYGE